MGAARLPCTRDASARLRALVAAGHKLRPGCRRTGESSASTSALRSASDRSQHGMPGCTSKSGRTCRRCPRVRSAHAARLNRAASTNRRSWSWTVRRIIFTRRSYPRSTSHPDTAVSQIIGFSQMPVLSSLQRCSDQLSHYVQVCTESDDQQALILVEIPPMRPTDVAPGADFAVQAGRSGPGGSRRLRTGSRHRDTREQRHF